MVPEGARARGGRFMLTSRRVNGIKTGFWSTAKKDDLVQKLGPLEEQGPQLVLDACRTVCPHKGPLNSQDDYCQGCPLWRLSKLLEGDR